VIRAGRAIVIWTGARGSAFLNSATDRDAKKPGERIALNQRGRYFLNSLSKAERGSFASTAALVVCRSTVLRGSNNSHSLRTSFFGIRSVIGFLH
jgi:hypothetical protein